MVGWHHHFSEHELGQTPGTDEGLGGLASMGSQRVRHDLETEQQHICIRAHLKSCGEGNGNPLQYSCLENPLDRGV